jgi:hypothetical protein
MMEVTLHRTPRLRDVVLQQIRVVGLSLRPGALVVAVVLAIGTLIIAQDLVRGHPAFDSSDMFPTTVFAFFFPFAVWRSEKRFGPDFLWTLPVDRRRLALAKVFAGWMWLMAVLAVFIVWLLGVTLIAQASPIKNLMRVPFTATAGMYLLGSAVVLGLRHPLRWILGAAGVLVLMGTLGDVISQPDDSEWQYVPGAVTYFSAVQKGRSVFLTMPDSAQWTITTFLWYGAGLAALWAATSRHGDRRRP